MDGNDLLVHTRSEPNTGHKNNKKKKKVITIKRYSSQSWYENMRNLTNEYYIDITFLANL